jgi:hypothetical protein
MKSAVSLPTTGSDDETDFLMPPGLGGASSSALGASSSASGNKKGKMEKHKKEKTAGTKPKKMWKKPATSKPPRFGRSLKDVLGDVDLSNVPRLNVPVPKMVYGPADDLVEFFSPPRLVPIARISGLKAELSCDLQTGWDLMMESHQRRALAELHRRRPVVLVVSPPCTLWSPLMDSNWLRMGEPLKTLRMKQGTQLLAFAMHACKIQKDAGRFFVFEHPHKAKSFEQSVVMDLEEGKNAAWRAKFDQCMFGLVSPRGEPMQKRTVLLTNIAAVHQRFHGMNCLGGHTHRRIESSQDGVKLSVYAQCYPDGMVRALVDAIKIHVSG